MIGRLEVVADENDLARHTADRFVDAARHAIRERGIFNAALAGGSTPKAAFALLTRTPLRAKIDWNLVRFYFGDERAVGPDDPDSNYRMAREHLFTPLRISDDAIHRIRGEAKPEVAADEYETLLREALGDPPIFDLIMLGMGPDGHTASLFPGTLATLDRHRLVTTTWVEKLNTHRITLTPRAINAGREIVVSAGGEGKADALAHVLTGPREPDRYPSQILDPTHGSLTWIVDRAAAKCLAR